VGLIQELVFQSARPHDTLLDPFAGSGVLAAAALADERWENTTVLLNDLSPASMAHIKKRFNGLGEQCIQWHDTISERIEVQSD